MKFFVTVSFFLLALGGFAQGLDGAEQIDFGRISKPTERTLTLYNRMGQPVVIISSAVDCNCTKVSYSPKPIKSGDSTVVRVVYTPSKEKGVFYKTVTLKNSTNKDFKFIVRGSVE